MKKALLISIIAMMLLGSFLMTACKEKAQEETPVDEAPTEETTPADTSVVVPAGDAAVPAPTDAPTTK